MEVTDGRVVKYEDGSLTRFVTAAGDELTRWKREDDEI